MFRRFFSHGATVCVLLIATSAAADKDPKNQAQSAQQKKSIEAMNRGIEAALAQRYGVAVRHLQRAVVADTGNHAAMYHLGRVELMRQRFAEATSAFAKAAEVLADEPMYHLMLGRTLYEDNKSAPAQEALERALALEPRLASAHLYLGRIHDAAGRAQEAAHAWTAACKLDPTRSSPFIKLGRLYLKWGKLDEARAVLEAGAKHARGEGVADIHYFLGLVHDSRQDWKASVAAYSAALALDADIAEAYLQRGLAYQKLYDHLNARNDLERFLGSRPAGTGFDRSAATEALLTITTEK